MKGSFIKMKKLIALLIAVSSLTISTSALADNYDSFDLRAIGTGVNSEHKGVSRNYATDGTDTNGNSNYSSPIFRVKDGSSDSIGLLPTYRAGDVLTFAIVPKSGNTPVQINAGDVLTFICSKQDGEDYDNDTVQYIDQVTLSPAANGTKTIYYTFKLREQLPDGRYKLEIKLGNVEKKITFSFLIGTPSAELLYVNNIADGQTPTKADKYHFEYGKAYCFGKAVVTGGANFTQTGAEIGFIFDTDGTEGFDPETDMKKTIGVVRKDASGAVAQDGRNIDQTFDQVLQTNKDHNTKYNEILGEAQYFFRTVIEGVYDNTVELTAEKRAELLSQLPDVKMYINK